MPISKGFNSYLALLDGHYLGVISVLRHSRKVLIATTIFLVLCRFEFTQGRCLDENLLEIGNAGQFKISNTGG